MHRLPLLLLSLLAASCTKKTYRFPNTSMEPTIKMEEFVTTDSKAYQDSSPQRWDVVAFESPLDSEQIWAFRVVGLPGESISLSGNGLSGNGLTINGTKLTYPTNLTKIKHEPAHIPKNFGLDHLKPPRLPLTLPPDHYFVLGDNAENALDSRFWGPLPITKVTGKVLGK